MISRFSFILFPFVCLNLIISVSATVRETVIRMDRGLYTFPVQYLCLDGTVGARGRLDIQRNRNSQLEEPTCFLNQRELIVVLRCSVTSPSASLMHHLSAHPSSDFARFTNGFLVVPASESEDLLVVNPESASAYALEGQIFYSPLMLRNGEPIWGVQTLIRFGGQPVVGSEEVFDCAILTEPNELLYLPPQIVDQLVARIHELGLRPWTPQGYSRIFYIEEHDASRLALLPTLDFVIVSEDNQHVQIASLEPHKYFIPTYTQGIYQSVFFFDGINRGLSSLCSLPHIVTKDLLIHFDTPRARIGFGEPLVELVH